MGEVIGGNYISTYSGDQIDGILDKADTYPDKSNGAIGQVPAIGENGIGWVTHTSFNGRTGAVTPQSGDYTAAMVGATPVIGKGINLLDNWYFIGGGSQQGGGKFPINQRGAASYAGAVYGIDRWKGLSSTVSYTIDSDGISISRPSGDFWCLEQRLETRPDSLVLTVSVLTDSGLSTFTFNNGFDNSSQYDGTVYVWLWTDGTNVAVYLGIVGSAAKFIAVKLELGDTQTLARNIGTEANPNWALNDPPPNYQQELAKCQRYYQLYATQSLRPSNAQDCRPVMRATPAQGTISIGGTTYYYNDANL